MTGFLGPPLAWIGDLGQVVTAPWSRAAPWKAGTMIPPAPCPQWEQILQPADPRGEEAEPGRVGGVTNRSSYSCCVCLLWPPLQMTTNCLMA